jgi:RNA polymerase sigma-70 factor (family 1)
MNSAGEQVNQLFKDVCATGNMKAYEQLYHLLCSRLIHFSASVCGSFHLAEEVVSDVFVSLWQKREQLSHVENPKVYLYVSTKNRTINAMKKKQLSVVPFDTLYTEALSIVPAVEEHLLSSQVARKIESAISSLPPRCQLIFRLIRMDGLQYKEVAELLDISSKTVDAQLTIAVKKVAETIRLDMSDELIADFLRSK